MKAHAPRAALAVLTLVVAACSPEHTIGTLVHEDAAHSPARSQALTPPPRILVARDPEGIVRFVDVDSFELVLGVRPPEGIGPLDLDVLVRDDGLASIALIAHDEEDQEGNLAVLPWTGAVFGRASRRGYYSGATHVTAILRGAVVFQEDLGQRWELALSGAGPVPSLPCPVPRSMISTEEGTNAMTFHTLGRSPEDVAQWIDVEVVAGHFASCDREDIAAPFEISRSARAALLEGVGVVLADVSDGDLLLSAKEEGGVGTPAVRPLSSTRIEAIVPWSTEGHRGLAVLGSDPPTVTIIGLDPHDDEALGAVEVQSLELEGDVALAWEFFSRDIAVVDGRLFVATSEGLEAFSIDVEPLGLTPIVLPNAIRELGGALAAMPSLDD